MGLVLTVWCGLRLGFGVLAAWLVVCISMCCTVVCLLGVSLFALDLVFGCDWFGVYGCLDFLV